MVKATKALSSRRHVPRRHACSTTTDAAASAPVPDLVAASPRPRRPRARLLQRQPPLLVAFLATCAIRTSRSPSRIRPATASAIVAVATVAIPVIPPPSLPHRVLPPAHCLLIHFPWPLRHRHSHRHIAAATVLTTLAASRSRPSQQPRHSSMLCTACSASE